jgi:hypothetical protein
MREQDFISKPILFDRKLDFITIQLGKTPSHEELGLRHRPNPAGLGDQYGGWAAGLCTRRSQQSRAGRCCARENEVKARAAWASRKEKRRRRNGPAGEYGPRGFENSFIFSSFRIKFEFESNSIESYMNSNAKHSTIQNKMQAA